MKQPQAYHTLKIGISSCLLGQKVRYDGGHKRCDYLLNIIKPYAELLPCCPEVEVGLSIPRPSLKLIGDKHHPRMVVVKDESQDITDKMLKFSQKRMKTFQDLDAYILKKDSPSCGMERVRVYQGKGLPPKMGQGLFAKTLVTHYPLLPVEEEGRLNDPMLRENFFERAFLYQQLKRLQAKPSAKAIVEFHSKHKLSLMAHSTEAYRELGRYVANIDKKNLAAYVNRYVEMMMQAFKLMATRRKHTNVLQHIYGYLKADMSATDKEEMLMVIEQYRQGHLPLVVPITLLRHHLNHTELDYIKEQIYLFPYPDELMLRNAL